MYKGQIMREGWTDRPTREERQEEYIKEWGDPKWSIQEQIDFLLDKLNSQVTLHMSVYQRTNKEPSDMASHAFLSIIDSISEKVNILKEKEYKDRTGNTIRFRA